MREWSVGEFRTRTVRPRATGVHGTVYVPLDAAPHVAALLIGGSGGNEPTYVAELLAGERIAALSVAYFGKDCLPPALGEIELGYFRTALDLLRSEVDRRDLAVVVMGQSRGSEAAMLTAIHFAELVDAVVVTVPSNGVLSGYPMGGPAWLLDSAPLPYAEDFGPDYDDPGVIIPVELARGPIMFVSAGSDEVWPSAPMARAMSERLVEHGDLYGHALLEYADASHSLGYLRPSLPPSLMLGALGDPPQTQAARADAWPKVLRFIRAVGDRERDHS
ncbi:MAG: acyl-CoA thioester hydrolase/BAAT C-terminal domain-containing protein [Candidatus Dormibacteria bacterium]